MDKEKNNQAEVKEQCPEFPFFGAKYPDARCIDGFLWDLDAFEDGMLTSGGEIPCPFCNTDEAIEWALDEEAGITEEVLRKNIEELKQKWS